MCYYCYHKLINFNIYIIFDESYLYFFLQKTRKKCIVSANIFDHKNKKFNSNNVHHHCVRIPVYCWTQHPNWKAKSGICVPHILTLEISTMYKIIHAVYLQNFFP